MRIRIDNFFRMSRSMVAFTTQLDTLFDSIALHTVCLTKDMGCPQTST